MHELAFADAVRPTPVVIFNLRLADYTLGHEILLLRRRNHLLISSPADFARLSFTDQICAIREAVWICAADYSDHDQLDQAARFSLTAIRSAIERWRWNRLTRKAALEDYILAQAEFRNYLAASRQCLPCPEERAAEVCAEANGYTPQSQMRGRSLGAPFIARLIDFAIQEDLAGQILPRSRFDVRRSVFDVPFALAANLYMTRSESDGGLWIENAEEHEEVAGREERLREFLARTAPSSTLHPPSSTPEAGLATPIPEELQ